MDGIADFFQELFYILNYYVVQWHLNIDVWKFKIEPTDGGYSIQFV